MTTLPKRLSVLPSSDGVDTSILMHYAHLLPSDITNLVELGKALFEHLASVNVYIKGLQREISFLPSKSDEIHFQPGGSLEQLFARRTELDASCLYRWQRPSDMRYDDSENRNNRLFSLISVQTAIVFAAAFEKEKSQAGAEGRDIEVWMQRWKGRAGGGKELILPWIMWGYAISRMAEWYGRQTPQTRSLTRSDLLAKMDGQITLLSGHLASRVTVRLRIDLPRTSSRGYTPPNAIIELVRAKHADPSLTPENLKAVSGSTTYTMRDFFVDREKERFARLCQMQARQEKPTPVLPEETGIRRKRQRQRASTVQVSRGVAKIPAAPKSRKRKRKAFEDSSEQEGTAGSGESEVSDDERPIPASSRVLRSRDPNLS